MSRILLIGGGGFIGSYLASELSDRGHTVDVIDNFTNAKGIPDEEFKKIVAFRKETLLKSSNLYQVDYDDFAKEYYEKNRPDVVMHLAASPLESDDYEIWTHQITKDISLTWRVALDALSRTTEDEGKKPYPIRFVYMSSLFAYGNIDSFSCNEEEPLKPRTGYGISKATGEFIVKSLFGKDDRLSYNIIRTTSIYGVGDANRRATQIFLQKAVEKQKFWVNKESYPDFIYIFDLVRGIADVIESNHKNQDFHISGGQARPLLDFVHELQKQFVYNLEYELKEGLGNDRPKRGSMDNTKARLLLGWNPKYDLSKGVENYVDLARRFNCF